MLYYAMQAILHYAMKRTEIVISWNILCNAM